MRSIAFALAAILILDVPATSQTIEKIQFDNRDTSEGYYLAIQPRSGTIKGTFVLCISFSDPEWMVAETKLHNVAYANDLLTILVSAKQKLYADTSATDRLNSVLKHVITNFKTDTSRFVLAGYDFAGGVILRYAEMALEKGSEFPVQPKAVIAINSPVDLFALWKWSDRQVRRNSMSAWDAKFITEIMTKEHGTITSSPQTYEKLTPFYAAADGTGNEHALSKIPLRLYYDVDPEWQLKERGNSLFDTFIPEGTELVSRLLAGGNKEAELVVAKQHGRNSRGIRTPNSLSIVDEVDCIHWIKNKLGIFDPNTWIPPYSFHAPQGWSEERFPFPIEFAPSIPYKGVEDLRFAPGWGIAGSEQYWSYSYLWWLEGKQKMNTLLLQQHMKAYYDGIVGRNIKERNIPSQKFVPTQVTLKKIETAPGDEETYQGSIRMLDYMAQTPITLNLKIHVKDCMSSDHTAVFFEISPKPFPHSIWTTLDLINSSINCIQ